MATQRTKATDEALTDMGLRAIEMALEDGESREFVGEAIGLPKLATATSTVSRDGVTIGFEDGDEYVVEVNVRRSLHRSDGATWCVEHARYEASTNDGDHARAGTR